MIEFTDDIFEIDQSAIVFFDTDQDLEDLQEFCNSYSCRIGYTEPPLAANIRGRLAFIHDISSSQYLLLQLTFKG